MGPGGGTSQSTGGTRASVYACGFSSPTLCPAQLCQPLGHFLSGGSWHEHPGPSQHSQMAPFFPSRETPSHTGSVSPRACWLGWQPPKRPLLPQSETRMRGHEPGHTLQSLDQCLQPPAEPQGRAPDSWVLIPAVHLSQAAHPSLCHGLITPGSLGSQRPAAVAWGSHCREAGSRRLCAL